MGASFRSEALEEALSQFGRPGIFNTSRGNRLTSPRFTEALLNGAVRLSVDGRSRWVDNVFTMSVWR